MDKWTITVPPGVPARHPAGTGCPTFSFPFPPKSLPYPTDASAPQVPFCGVTGPRDAPAPPVIKMLIQCLLFLLPTSLGPSPSAARLFISPPPPPLYEEIPHAPLITHHQQWLLSSISCMD